MARLPTSIPDLGPLTEATNQPPVRGDCNLWTQDPALRGAVAAAGGQAKMLSAYGARLGCATTRELGRDANRHPPELELFDRGGRRLDRVRFHPSYHDLMRLGIGSGYSAVAWDGTAGGHATHAAMVYLHSQVEPGTCCPMTMTYAAVPALRASPAIEAGWRAGLLSRSYDGGDRPGTGKAGLTMGMAMTEKQGGSDLRSNVTRAVPDGADYRLYGHKWFCSAPMSDGFLTLAQAPGGLSCFVVPRWHPDGTKNPIHLMRLKDKLGNRANASAELEYHGAWAQLLGDEGAGVRVIIDMVHHTRLDTAMAPAGLMRAALSEAYYWAAHRSAFQRRLIDQPLMRAVLCDLTLDWLGALHLGMRVARAFDTSGEEARAFARISVALAKFLSNKCCPGVVYEAMEALGGMGYVEDTPLPLLFRESPLNSIWEGSGNVICLDILRTLGRDPLAASALRAELEIARGVIAGYDTAFEAHFKRWPTLPPESEARWFVSALAELLCAATLIAKAPMPAVEAYVKTRLSGARGSVAGAVSGLDEAAILATFAP